MCRADVHEIVVSWVIYDLVRCFVKIRKQKIPIDSPRFYFFVLATLNKNALIQALVFGRTLENGSRSGT